MSLSPLEGVAVFCFRSRAAVVVVDVGCDNGDCDDDDGDYDGLDRFISIRPAKLMRVSARPILFSF